MYQYSLYTYQRQSIWDYIDGLVQDCSNSSELAAELLQPCAMSST